MIPASNAPHTHPPSPNPQPLPPAPTTNHARAVACVDDDVKDGYGAQLGRKGSCKDTASTVKVTITDTCEERALV